MRTGFGSLAARGGQSSLWCMGKPMKAIAVNLVKFYQKAISIFFISGFSSLSGGCRFYPSCSQYSITAFEKHGFMKGLKKSFFRILRCGPWSPGGSDLP